MQRTLSDDVWRHACAVAICSLPAMGPARLRALLADMPPETAWATIAEKGTLPPELVRACGSNPHKLASAWSKAARLTDPLTLLDRYRHADIGVWTLFDEYPSALMSDSWAPAVLFWQGDRRCLELPRVAIIGTRQASHQGREIAQQLGMELAESGVCVVSGLALGIDGAAHTGALESSWGAPPLAVVGSGLDTIYPKRHASLWRSIAQRGLLLGEAPLGAQPEPWRFPARNRIIAALADIVVVVESHAHGGSLLTAEEADMRGVMVMAVPGSLRNPASRGTNELISAGCPMVTKTEDILDLLPIDVSSTTSTGHPSEDPVVAEVLDAVDWAPTTTDEVLLRTGRELGEVATALIHLERAGLITGKGDTWQRLEDGRSR